VRIFTIGYEATTMAEFLSALQQAGIERVIDVRAVPNSRRPGFSKNPLKNALAEVGIDYVHLKALGTPADGRAAARAGRHADLERIYAGQLDLPEAIVQSEQMRELADDNAPVSVAGSLTDCRRRCACIAATSQSVNPGVIAS